MAVTIIKVPVPKEEYERRMADALATLAALLLEADDGQTD